MGPLEIFILFLVVAVPLAIIIAVVRRVRRFRLRVSGRMNSRPCTQCGERVANGLVICPTCGYDFTIVSRTTPDGAQAPR